MNFGWVFTRINPHVRFVRRQLCRSTTSAQTSTSAISAGNVECVTKVIGNMDRTNNHVEAAHKWQRTITSRQPINDLQMDHPPGLRKTRFFFKKKTTVFWVCLEQNGFLKKETRFFVLFLRITQKPHFELFSFHHHAISLTIFRITQ